MSDRHAPLVSVETASRHLEDPDWVFFDVRHDLMDPEAGPTAYAASHIPGAFHAHIDRDLSAPVGDGTRGRHPLPDSAAFTAWLRERGVHADSQIVCYDDAGGMWAGRLWWLLRHHGHAHAAVLDGGLARWTRKELPLDSETPALPGDGTFDGADGHMALVDEEAIAAGAVGTLIDARAPERFTGEVEPVDPAAGHIPGAVNLPFAGNLSEDGRFLGPDELRARFEAAGDACTVYCGSGVTAAHNVLAMDVAGLPLPALYPGSWSAWSTQGRDVET